MDLTADSTDRHSSEKDVEMLLDIDLDEPHDRLNGRASTGPELSQLSKVDNSHSGLTKSRTWPSITPESGTRNDEDEDISHKMQEYLFASMRKSSSHLLHDLQVVNEEEMLLGDDEEDGSRMDERSRSRNRRKKRAIPMRDFSNGSSARYDAPGSPQHADVDGDSYEEYGRDNAYQFFSQIGRKMKDTVQDMSNSSFTLSFLKQPRQRKSESGSASSEEDVTRNPRIPLKDIHPFYHIVASSFRLPFYHLSKDDFGRAGIPIIFSIVKVWFTII